MKFPALLQKIVVSIVVLTTLFAVVSPLTLAANQEYAPIPPVEPKHFNEPTTYTPTTYSQTNSQDRTQVALLEGVNAIMCQLTGYNMINKEKPCLTINVASGKIEYSKQAENGMVGGLLGQVSTLIGSTYNIPVHTSHYTDYLAQNFGLTEKAYAQGTGFTTLQPLLSLWTRVRDLCYLAFVVIFVIIGFGIMLRIKIDPRTVMAVQNQIPKIIIAILLITFSYAIAGFLVDTMWTVTYIGINVLTADAPCPGTTAQTFTDNATRNLLNTPMQYVWNLFGNSGCTGTSWGIASLAHNIGQTLGLLITSIIGAGLFGDGTSTASCGLTAFMECVKQASTYIFSFIFGIVATLIIFVAILVQLIRVWFALLKGYFYVVMYTLLGPFYILLGLIPGTQSFGFEHWIRYMVSSLSMFPATAFIFIVGVILANNPTINTPDSAAHFIPPLIGNPNISNNLGMLIALGTILISPEIVNMMRNAFKASPSKYTPQIFKGLGSGVAPVQAFGSKGFGHATRSADPTRGDNGGWLRNVIQGSPSKYYSTRTNAFGQSEQYTDYSKVNLRYKLGEMVLGKGK